MLWWVISATKIETQHGRIDEIVTKAAAGERARRSKSNNTNPTTTTMELHGLNGFG